MSTGGTPADLSLKVPLATVGVWTGLRGEAASGNVVAAVQAGSGTLVSVSVMKEKSPVRGRRIKVDAQVSSLSG